MSLIDAFGGSAFKMSSLADAINVVPNSYGRVREMGLVRPKSLATKTFQIEFKNGVLNLLPTSNRGGHNGTVGRTPKRNIRNYQVLHIEHDDFIYADDIQDVRAFGSEYQLQALQDLVNDKLETLSGKFDITEEWHLVNMIQGKMIDADGTVLFNAFTDFGVTEKVISFEFGNANADMGKKCLDLLRYTEDNAMGETITGVHGLVSSDWFDNFTGHGSIKEAYKYYTSTQEPLREDTRRRFVHKGVVLEEYRGSATSLNSDDTTTTRKFIADGEARFFPIGTRQTFQAAYGPADFVSAANKPGQRLAVRMLPDPSGKDKFVGIHAQTNPFYMCSRPQLLTRGTA